jgi:hypothetical protein
VKINLNFSQIEPPIMSINRKWICLKCNQNYQMKNKCKFLNYHKHNRNRVNSLKKINSLKKANTIKIKYNQRNPLFKVLETFY